MSLKNDQHYLLTKQYHNAANLNARIQLHTRFSTNAYGWHPWIFDQFKIAPHSRVLELGCGPARLWTQNSARIPEEWDITLSDFSAGMLEEARRNLAGVRRRFSFEVIDAQSIPFEDASFDAVIANHMLYHVPARAKALSEIRRVLRPGGRFYASTVGAAHLREIGELVRRFDPQIIFGIGDEASFTLENGAQQLAPYFSNVAVYRYDDALIVTEAEPLIAYVLSGRVGAALEGDRVAEFAAFVQRELAQHGTIHITKDSGLFEVW
ncbi:MAG TPA: class I SAM-dependent methyltransferase [Roseiflexaceae bacterium]|nr:class I SAM-dependent methyltransferase [Roseiflexaceae bacterium]